MQQELAVLRGALAGLPDDERGPAAAALQRLEARVRGGPADAAAPPRSISLARSAAVPRRRVPSRASSAVPGGRAATASPSHPSHDGGLRSEIEARYGIARPDTTGGSRRACGLRPASSGAIAQPRTVQPKQLLPRLNRADPSADPPKVYPSQLAEGVESLVSRGFIPASADLTPAFSHMPAPVTAGAAVLHLDAERHLRADIYSSPFGYTASNLKLDLGGVGVTMASRRQRTSDERARTASRAGMRAAGARAGIGRRKRTPSQRQQQHQQQQQQQRGGTPVASLSVRTPSLGALSPLGGWREGENGGSPAAAAGARQKDAGGAARRNTRSAPARAAGGTDQGGGFDVVPPTTAALELDDGTGSSHGSSPSRSVRVDGHAVAEQACGTASLPLHANHLVVKGGQFADSPALARFLAQHGGQGALRKLMAALEGLLRHYAVELAIVDSRELLVLAKASPAPEPSADALLSALVNEAQVRAIMGRPGQRFQGSEGQGATAAAVVLQAAWRGKAGRSRHAVWQGRDAAAGHIGRCWRRASQRRRFETARAGRAEARDAAWAASQALFCADWPRLSAARRVEVHVPSLSYADGAARSLGNLAARQNAQLSRLCRVADPFVEVVYVSPFPLSETVTAYYQKLLKAQDVDPSRFSVVYPENMERLPYGLPLASLLLHSPRALRRIRHFCAGKEAYVVPNLVGADDKSLSIELGLPLLGAEPATARRLGLKCNARELFLGAGVGVPDGTSVAAGRASSLLPECAAGIVRDPSVPRWLFKLNTGFGGRGHAYFDVDFLRSHARLVAALAAQAEPMQPDEAAAWAEEMAAELESVAGARVQFPGFSMQQSWPEFVDAVERVGCTVEASPRNISGSPSVNLSLSPAGAVSVTSTHDQIFSPPYCFVGASFPQSSVPYDGLRDAALAVGETLVAQGVMGCVGVDFVAFNAPSGLVLWAVDLNMRRPDTAASFELFDFLARGVFDGGRTGRYFVELPGSAGSGAPVLATRNYVSAPFIQHENLPNAQYNKFFNACRTAGVSFDLQQLGGTAFHLLDSFAAGTIGMSCVGGSLLECFEVASDTCGFMERQLGRGAGETDSSFEALQNAVRFVCRILQKADS